MYIDKSNNSFVFNFVNKIIKKLLYCIFEISLADFRQIFYQTITDMLNKLNIKNLKNNLDMMNHT